MITFHVPNSTVKEKESVLTNLLCSIIVLYENDKKVGAWDYEIITSLTRYRKVFSKVENAKGHFHHKVKRENSPVCHKIWNKIKNECLSWQCQLLSFCFKTFDTKCFAIYSSTSVLFCNFFSPFLFFCFCSYISLQLTFFFFFFRIVLASLKIWQCLSFYFILVSKNSIVKPYHWRNVPTKIRINCFAHLVVQHKNSYLIKLQSV